MDNDEIKRKINERIDQDSDFAKKLGESVERGFWQVVADMLARAFGWVMSRAEQIAQWLIDNW